MNRIIPSIVSPREMFSEMEKAWREGDEGTSANRPMNAGKPTLPATPRSLCADYAASHARSETATGIGRMPGNQRPMTPATDQVRASHRRMACNSSLQPLENRSLMN